MASLLECIHSKPPKREGKDTFVWKGGKNGGFSIKSFYSLDLMSSMKSPAKEVWVTGVPSRAFSLFFVGDRRGKDTIDQLMTKGWPLVNIVFFFLILVKKENMLKALVNGFW